MSPSTPSTSAARGRTALTLPPAGLGVRGQRHHLPLGGEDDGGPQRAVGRLLPQAIPDQAGNGFRIAMRPTQQGESCADAFLAGVLERFQEMQVFFNPREESYERLGTFGRRPRSPGRTRAGAPCCAAKPTAAWSSPPPTAPPIPTWPSPC